MSSSNKLARLAARMDALYEFDREPVAASELKPGRYFAGLFAGEHVAATEFVIGAFFVLHGVELGDLLLGLLIGNFLAVMSWTFVCAPIATDTRLTLYWHLRKIAGPGLMVIYNVANAVLYCILAGAMIAVSATALGLAFGLATPELTDFYPQSVSWVLTTVFIGSVITLFAILGFEKLSRLAGFLAPFIFAAFIVGAFLSLPSSVLLRTSGISWRSHGLVFGTAFPRPARRNSASGTSCFSRGSPTSRCTWGCRTWRSSVTRSGGPTASTRPSVDLRPLLGHRHVPGAHAGLALFGIMVAAVSREMNPGLMAYEALGIAGAVTVFVAGWTTANPTLYRAGLALQTVTPNWPRWKVTLIAGLLTTFFSSFPAVFLKLLDYVALYGLILMPVGAVVFAEHWLVPRLGGERYEAERTGTMIAWKVVVVWIGTLVACYFMPLHLYFRWLPGYFLALVAYLVLRRT